VKQVLKLAGERSDTQDELLKAIFELCLLWLNWLGGTFIPIQSTLFSHLSSQILEKMAQRYSSLKQLANFLRFLSGQN
jgi:hypothetical protein